MLNKILVFMYEHKKRMIVASSVIVMLGFIAMWFFFSNIRASGKEKPIKAKFLSVEKDKDNNNELITDSQEWYYVDIKGAVTLPSVYQLEKGSRITDVIKKAGGLTKEADTSVLNLSKKISDEMTIIVYTRNQIKDYKNHLSSNNVTEVIKYIEQECNCPDPTINNACVCNNNEGTSQNKQNEAKISINTANVEQLQTLPSIGEAKAQNIINYRNENGLFTTIEDIKEVTGIGDSIFAKIKDYITI